MKERKFQDPYADARRVLRAFWESEPMLLASLREAMFDENGRLQVDPPLILKGFEHVTCGAKTRKGTPCAARRLWPPSYRCELHGGLSWRPHNARARESLNPQSAEARSEEGAS
jgi:hypothetical protein